MAKKAKSILVLVKHGEGYAIVTEYSSMSVCDKDMQNENYLKAHPELDGSTVTVAAVEKQVVICDPKVTKALEALKTGGFTEAEAKQMLGLDEPKASKPDTSVEQEPSGIPDNWETSKIKELRKLAKIACPDEGTSGWTKDACVQAIGNYLLEQKKEHTANKLPMPEEPGPMIPPPPSPTTTAAPPPVIPTPGTTVGAPPPVPAPGTAAQAAQPPVPNIPSVTPPSQGVTGAIPATPPPPPLD